MRRPRATCTNLNTEGESRITQQRCEVPSSHPLVLSQSQPQPDERTFPHLFDAFRAVAPVTYRHRPPVGSYGFMGSHEPYKVKFVRKLSTKRQRKHLKPAPGTWISISYYVIVSKSKKVVLFYEPLKKMGIRHFCASYFQPKRERRFHRLYEIAFGELWQCLPHHCHKLPWGKASMPT